MPREKSVGAVVFRKQGKETRFLLLHYAAGHWGFPKGHVEKGEREQQTIEREIGEETGLLQVRFLPGFKQHTSYFFKSRGETVFKEVVFLLAESKQGDVRVSREHSSFQWLPFQRAVRKLTFKNTRDVLRKANAFLKQEQLSEF